MIDPATGYPVENDVEAVTIVGKSGHSAECDGFSTTALLLGTKAGMKFMEKQDGYEALFIDKDNKITKTDGMEFDKSDSN